jgi:hypothetical protein
MEESETKIAGQDQLAQSRFVEIEFWVINPTWYNICRQPVVTSYWQFFYYFAILQIRDEQNKLK